MGGREIEINFYVYPTKSVRDKLNTIQTKETTLKTILK